MQKASEHAVSQGVSGDGVLPADRLLWACVPGRTSVSWFFSARLHTGPAMSA